MAREGSATVRKRAGRLAARAGGLPAAFVVARICRLSSRRVGLALAYHSVAAQPGDPALELVPPHDANLFDAEMRHLTRTYRIVLAAELARAIAERKRGERFPAAVTFDDDLQSHVDVALPILLQRHVHATFFLTGASLHGAFGFWWERLQRAVDNHDSRLAEIQAAVGMESNRPRREEIHALGRRIEALSVEERDRLSNLVGEIAPDPDDAGLREAGVRSLVAEGMAIGFHTRRHHPLPDLTDARLDAAMKDGRQELEQLAGAPLVVIGYPHGRADERVAAAARAAGFLAGYTGVAESVRDGQDSLLLGRLNPSYRSTGHFALQLVLALVRGHR